MNGTLRLIGAPKRASVEAQAAELAKRIERAGAVVIGAGAGLSTSAGLTYSGPRFERWFADFIKKYGFTDMYSAGFYPFDGMEEHWAFWSRFIYCNRYDQAAGAPYRDLLDIVGGRDYFVLTTNVDHQFQVAGFDKRRLFYTQGDYGLFQCSVPCHKETYDNEAQVRAMLEAQGFTAGADGTFDPASCAEPLMRIPSDLVPCCPRCGEPMSMNLRADNTFVEDEGWHRAAGRWEDFKRRHANMRIVYLELGVGFNTPVIIKFPFWQATAGNRRATYACINAGEAVAPVEIEHQAILMDADIAAVLAQVKERLAR